MDRMTDKQRQQVDTVLIDEKVKTRHRFEVCLHELAVKRHVDVTS